jgi:hypothetical protein
VGMSCSLGSHDAVCEELAREEELDMTLAHDGLTIGPWPAGALARAKQRWRVCAVCFIVVFLSLLSRLEFKHFEQQMEQPKQRRPLFAVTPLMNDDLLQLCRFGKLSMTNSVPYSSIPAGA